MRKELISCDFWSTKLLFLQIVLTANYSSLGIDLSGGGAFSALRTDFRARKVALRYFEVCRTRSEVSWTL